MLTAFKKLNIRSNTIVTNTKEEGLETVYNVGPLSMWGN